MDSYFMVNWTPKPINEPKPHHYALVLTIDHFKEHASMCVIKNCKHKFLSTTVVVSTITQFLILPVLTPVIRKMKIKNRDNLPQLHFGIMDSVCHFNISLSCNNENLPQNYLLQLFKSLR